MNVSFDKQRHYTMKTDKTIKTIILILLSVLILTGCAQKTNNKEDLCIL